MFRRWIKTQTLLSVLVVAAQAGAETRLGNLFNKAGWAQLQIADGRLRLAGVESQHNETKSSANPDQGITESLAISGYVNAVDLHYELTDPRQQITVEFSRHQVRIARRPIAGAAVLPVEFVQDDRGVSLTVGYHGRQTEYEAQTIWRLLLVHREAGAHFSQLLEWLQPGWEMAETIGRIEQALVQAAEIDLASQQRHCDALIEQLSSANFQQRRAAARQLRAMGPIVLAHVRQRQCDGLDAEQRLQIAAATSWLNRCQGDAPQSVALRLIDAGPVWLTLLAHPDPPVRNTARLQLQRIYERPIDVDLQADSETLHRQIARLAREIER